MIPQHLTDAVAEAERRLAPLQRKVSMPGATLEDEHALERGRNRLLQAELNVSKAEASALRSALRNKPMTKPEPKRLTAREKAEAHFKEMS